MLFNIILITTLIINYRYYLNLLPLAKQKLTAKTSAKFPLPFDKFKVKSGILAWTSRPIAFHRHYGVSKSSPCALFM